MTEIMEYFTRIPIKVEWRRPFSFLLEFPEVVLQRSHLGLPHIINADPPEAGEVGSDSCGLARSEHW
jgi:hypothetical protein